MKNCKLAFWGETFDSRAELARYHELRLLEKAGKIRNLKRQASTGFIYELDGKEVVEE